MKGKPDRGLQDGMRLQLLALGIPEHEHTFQALAEKFPAEFKIQDSKFDLDTLAKVLVHLAGAGILKLGRRTGQSRREPR